MEGKPETMQVNPVLHNLEFKIYFREDVFEYKLLTVGCVPG